MRYDRAWLQDRPPGLRLRIQVVVRSSFGGKLLPLLIQKAFVLGPCDTAGVVDAEFNYIPADACYCQKEDI